MKQVAFCILVASSIIEFSCFVDGNLPPALQQEHPSTLQKCLVCTISIKVGPYYRSTDSTWCVGMRIFRDDGTPLPINGGYVWYRDVAPCDSIDNWVLWADSVKCLTATGLNNADQLLSRFALKATYGGNETPRIIVGRDMSAHQETGCQASPCSDPDSLFGFSYLTCDSLDAM